MKFKSKGQKGIFIVVVLAVVLSLGLVVDNKVNKENSVISKITTNSKNNDGEEVSKNSNSDKNSSDNSNDSTNGNNNSNEADSDLDKGNSSENESSEGNIVHVSSNPSGKNGSYNFNAKQKDTKINSKKLPYKLPDKEGLSVVKIGQYSGQFLESGKDEQVDDTFAIIVKNKSKDMLQYAQLNFKVKGEDANFVVTNLPPGKSALVLEANKKSFSKTNDITYEGASTSYIDSDVMNKDKFKVTSDNTKLTLKNLTNKKYSTVYVYYKNIDEDGDYLGGITYRTKFENVGANKSVTIDTEHYLKGASQIVMVDYIE